MSALPRVVVQFPQDPPTWHDTKNPSLVAFIVSIFTDQVELSRHFPCASVLRSCEVSGTSDTRRTLWYRMEFTRQDFLCVFEKGDKLALVISTLEVLAVLIALKLFDGEVPPAHHGHSHLDRYQRQRVSTQEADDDPIPGERCAHGAGQFVEDDVHEGRPSGLTFERLQSRGRCIGQWRNERFLTIAQSSFRFCDAVVEGAPVGLTSCSLLRLRTRAFSRTGRKRGFVWRNDSVFRIVVMELEPVVVFTSLGAFLVPPQVVELLMHEVTHFSIHSAHV